MGRASFNPHPARCPGATLIASLMGVSLKGFNPHPARCPGATNVLRVKLYVHAVSILTRRDVRVQPVDSMPPLDRRFCFNPHPARCPGATRDPRHQRAGEKEFQSSPGAMSGCNWHYRADLLGARKVSILTRRDVRVQHWGAPAIHGSIGVSILTRRDVRVQHLDAPPTAA